MQQTTVKAPNGIPAKLQCPKLGGDQWNLPAYARLPRVDCRCSVLIGQRLVEPDDQVLLIIDELLQCPGDGRGPIQLSVLSHLMQQCRCCSTLLWAEANETRSTLKGEINALTLQCPLVGGALVKK